MADSVQLAAHQKFRIRVPIAVDEDRRPFVFTIIDDSDLDPSNSPAADILIKSGNVALERSDVPRRGMLVLQVAKSQLRQVQDPIEIVVKAPSTGFRGTFTFSFQ